MARGQIQARLDGERQAILERCTACGKCVEVCPMLPFLEVRSVPTEDVARGLLAILRGEHDRNGAIFAEACSGSARCRNVCPEQLDPYHFMRLAKLPLRKP